MGLLSRFKHSRGFGIHSPFAYRFLTEVLHETTPYYDQAGKGRKQRLLTRMRAFVDPMQQAELEDVRPVKVVDLAPESTVIPATDGNTIIYIDRPGAADTAINVRLDELGYGITFRSQRGASVIIPFRRLPRQVIETRF